MLPPFRGIHNVQAGVGSRGNLFRPFSILIFIINLLYLIFLIAKSTLSQIMLPKVRKWREKKIKQFIILYKIFFFKCLAGASTVTSTDIRFLDLENRPSYCICRQSLSWRTVINRRFFPLSRDFHACCCRNEISGSLAIPLLSDSQIQ